MSIIELSNTRPVRLDATADSVVQWIYKQHYIDVIFLDGYFWVRSRPMGKDYLPLAFEQTIWPVRTYREQAETAKHLNRLLIATCRAIDRKEYKYCKAKPYTQDGPFLAYLQALEQSSGAKQKIRINALELIAVKEQVKKQLMLF